MRAGRLVALAFPGRAAGMRAGRLVAVALPGRAAGVRARRLVAVALAGASCGVLAVAGCGVETEEHARRVNPPSGVAHAWATTTPPENGTGSVPERVFLVRGGGLVAVTRHLPAEPTVNELVDDLLAGPTPAERGAGMTTALRAADVAGVQVSGGRATVELTGVLDGGGRTDQVLAFAQIVCTLTAKAGITSVAFTHDRQAVGVPRADGSLSHAPASAADYATLLTR